MPDDESDWFQRNFIERRAPATWRWIGADFLIGSCALAALLIGPGTGRSAWEVVAGAVVLITLIQVLRGITRMAWLAMGGTDRPLRTYLLKRFGS